MLFTVVEGDGVGGKELVLETGERVGGGVPEEATGQFDELVRRGRNKLLSLDDDVKVFAEWYGPPPRVFVYGAVDTAEALCKAAKLLGWTAIVGDARGMFLTPERMPSADVLIQKWPEEALAEIAPDHQTAVVVLTHDDKFDEPALKAALESEAFYVGALGSRRTTERRRGRLLEAGVPRSSSTGSWARAASTSAPTRRRRRRSRSWPRSSPCAPAAAAARCATPSTGSTSRWRSIGPAEAGRPAQPCTLVRACQSCAGSSAQSGSSRSSATALPRLGRGTPCDADAAARAAARTPPWRGPRANGR